MSLIERIIDKLTADYEKEYTVVAFEAEEKPGGVECVTFLYVDVLSHKETDELKFEKDSEIISQHTQNTSFTEKEVLGDESGTPFPLDGCETKVHRYDMLPEVFAE